MEVARRPLPGCAQVARHEELLSSDLFCDLSGRTVDLECALPKADGRQFSPATIEGHYLQNLAAGILHLKM